MRGKRAPAPPQGLDARRLARNWLAAVLEKKQSLADAAPQADLARLDPRDAALARHLTLATLRHLGQLRNLIRRALDKPLSGAAKGIEPTLLIGAAQIFFANIPAHAAVATSVALIARDRREQVRAFKGLANAVLRRLASDEGTAWIAAQDTAQLNTPKWAWERWVKAYGADTTRAIAQAHLTPAPLDLQVRDAAAEAAFRAAMPTAEPLPTGGLRLAGSHLVPELPGYAEGTWWVQDAAAALAARLLRPAPGMRIADLCAAPGGKTMALAAAGAHVTAVDVSKKRLSILKDNLDRTGLAADIVAADIRTWNPAAQFDAVLLDAPCSATGTIRRHPDLLHIKREADILALTGVQEGLLDKAAQHVRPGGSLVYAVCSLEPEEGERQITAFLARNKGFATDAIAPADVAGLDDAVTPEGWLRLLPSHWPERGGLDGFFIARLSRH